MGDFVVLRAAARMVSQGGGKRAGAAHRTGTVWVWQRLLAGVGKSGEPPSGLEPFVAVRQEELARDGLEMDVKTIARITYQCGSGMLALRTDELMRWRLGKLPAGKEFEGKRISVQIDGGRTKIRGDLRPAAAEAEKTDEEGLPIENVPGRSKKRPRQTFDAEWREPKLVTIFVHDEHGRMEKQSRAIVDGTFLGPDAMAELVAMHLHRLGAARAASITFAADGAPWIWDRLPTIVRLAKLDGVPIHEVLDCCHAAHHISLALAAMGQNDRERMPLYREHRTLLRNGQWRRVVEELTGLAEMDAGERGCPHRDRVPEQARRSRAFAVSDLPQIGPSLGQRGDREQHPSGDQSPSEEQWDVLARRACGRNASGAGTGHFQTLGRSSRRRCDNTFATMVEPTGNGNPRR